MPHFVSMWMDSLSCWCLLNQVYEHHPHSLNFPKSTPGKVGTIVWDWIAVCMDTTELLRPEIFCLVYQVLEQSQHGGKHCRQDMQRDRSSKDWQVTLTCQQNKFLDAWCKKNKPHTWGGQHTPLALFLPQPHRLQASIGIPLDYGYFILFCFETDGTNSITNQNQCSLNQSSNRVG